MSIATEITRLQNAKASIKTSIENKGVTVPSATKLDGYSSLIDSIPTGSQVTVEPLSVTQNGTYQETGKAYSPVTVNVQGGGGGTGDDVVFIDYDGTVLYKYSKAEIDAMSALPSNPTHAGLTSQGWNWSLADIKSQLTAYPNQPVYVGQMYITDNGDTRLYVHFEEGRTSPYLGLGVNGTVTIDWGDNSATDTLTGTSTSSIATIQHIYQAGDYVIKLTPTSGSFLIAGVSNTSYLLRVANNTTSIISRVYTNAVRKIELGSSVSLNSYAFNYCYSLASITIPNSVTSLGTYAFSSCYSLASITIPNSVTSLGSNVFSGCHSLASITIPSGVTSLETYAFSNCSSLASITIPNSVTSLESNVFNGCSSLASITIPNSVTSFGSNVFNGCSSLASITIPSGVTSLGNNVFSNCSSLASITIPSGVTSIGSSVFSGCYSLASITIPSSVTSIGSSAFSSCHGMAEYHFLPTAPPTLLNTNAFNNIQSDCVIYVPYSADHSILNAYKTASNWSTYASRMQEELQ